MLEYFEHRSNHYQVRSERGLWRQLRQREKQAILNLLKPQRGESLVDLGCGTGYYAVPLQFQYGMRVVGIDSSPGMIQVLAQANVQSYLMDVEDLHGIGRFDKALAAGVLEFVRQPERFFSRCYDILHPGGRLVILVPAAGIKGWLYESLHRLRGCPTYARPLSEYIRLAEFAGLSLKETIHCTPISVAVSFEK